MKAIIHLLLSYVGLLASFLATALLGLIIPPLGRSTNLGGRLLNEPVWLLAIVAAFFYGFYFYPKFPTKLVFAIWVVPTAILFYQAWRWHLTMARYDSTWDTFFSSGCGGSECLYEALFTAPFYATVAYSVGAFVSATQVHLQMQKRANVKPPAS